MYMEQQNSFIWNRQRKRSFPACEVAVKLHFIVSKRTAEKAPEGGSAPGPREGPRPQTFHQGFHPLDPLPPFR